MKKIVIGVLALAIGLSANAAATKWEFSTTSSANIGGTALSSGTVYLFMAADAATALADAQDAITALAAGQSIDGYATTLAINSSGKVSKTTATLDYTDGQKAFFRSVIVSDDSAAKGYAYLSSQITKTASTSAAVSTVLVLNNSNKRGDWSAGATAIGWYATSMPEPTSGLLMLVGLGLLGLRRRRA